MQLYRVLWREKKWRISRNIRTLPVSRIEPRPQKTTDEGETGDNSNFGFSDSARLRASVTQLEGQ